MLVNSNLHDKINIVCSNKLNKTETHYNISNPIERMQCILDDIGQGSQIVFVVYDSTKITCLLNINTIYGFRHVSGTIAIINENIDIASLESMSIAIDQLN
jgi:hypothetical protein